MSSLLLVLIVVVWLFVLAPLVINRQEPIRRTSEALGKTRVLHRGGEKLSSQRRRPTFSERDVRKSEEVDESLETVDAQLDDDTSIDDVLYDDTAAKETAKSQAKVTEAPQETDVEPVIEGDVVYELEAAKAHEASEQEAGDAAEAPAAPVAPVAPQADAGEGETTVSVDRAIKDDFVDADDLMFNEAADTDDPAEADADADAADAAEPETAETSEGTELETAQSPDGIPGAAAPEPADDELTADDYEFAAKRKGRGGFDPVEDAKYAQTRFVRRQRSVTGLALFIVAAVVLGIFVGGWTWWIPLIGVGLLALYLVNLRRTVRAEEELRRRRIKRMKLARQGVRNVEDEELGVPQRLRRPGAVVVELDDEDPDFADLPYLEHEPQFDDDVRRVAG